MTEVNLTPMAFQFSAKKQKVRSLLINSEPFFVAKDICDILEHTNVSVAIKMLDSDERSKKSLGRQGSTWLISESGLYALIMRSNKPKAKLFRKWVTSEVLPAIRKKGYYGLRELQNDFIDARDLPYAKKVFNGIPIRCIDIDKIEYFSVNDIHKSINSTTVSTQSVKKLNKKQLLAKKIWLFGNTHPAWFTTKLGFKLIISGSRIFNTSNQIMLEL